jgi:ribonuclease P protein component
MLPSKYRLKKRIDFARSEIDGKLFQSKNFGVNIFDRKDSDNSRFAFIISTKISKKAVVRNKIRRIMSDIIRLNLDKIKTGLDVVFLVKPTILKSHRKEIEDETLKTIASNLQK